MGDYKLYTIDADFAGKLNERTVRVGKEEEMNRALAWAVIDGRKMGVWRVRNREDNGDLTVVAFYSTDRYGRNGRYEKVVTAFWVRESVGAKELFGECDC